MTNSEALDEFASTISAFSLDKKILKKYLFVIINLGDKVRVAVFYNNSFSFSFYSKDSDLTKILLGLDLGDGEVRNIVKSVNCVHLSVDLIK